MDLSEFTPTQKRLLEVLSDGMMHSNYELLGCLNDELASIGTVRAHIYYLRTRLRPKGYDIVAHRIGKDHTFRKVRILASNNQ